MEINIVHTADVHIGMKFENACFSGEFSQIRHDEIKQTFFRIVNFAKEENADFLLIAGDLFENDYVRRSDLKEIRQAFQTLDKTEIILAAGNHDPIFGNSYYKNFEFGHNVHIFPNKYDKIVFPDKNTAIWGYSWDRSYVEYDAVSAINGLDRTMINILVVHGDIYTKDSKYMPLDKNNLLSKGFDYIALGHIHKNSFSADNMAYPGSPEPLDFGETGEHGFIAGKIEKPWTEAEYNGNDLLRAKIDMKFLPFSKREFIIREILLNENMTGHDIDSVIINCDTEENRLKNLYRIILKGFHDKDIALESAEFETRLGTHFKYIEIINEASPGYDLERLRLENKDNLIGAFISEMEALGLEDDINKNALRYGLEELLREKEK